MDKKVYTCDICILQLPENNKISHESGRRHRTNLQKLGLDVPPLETPPPPSQPDDTVIFVNGYPPYTTSKDLVKAFSAIGSVKAEKFGRKFAIMRFDSEKIRDEAVTYSGKIILYGSSLKIQPIKNKELESDENDSKNGFVYSKRKEFVVPPSSIDLSGNFVQQCHAIFTAVRMTRDQVESISLLYSQLTELFQHLWPGCVAVPFGSITTGLGIKSSDADCFIDVPPPFRSENHVAKARRKLAGYPQIFTDIVAIPRANTPIVKFFHIPTETNCDVSFKTPLGARNSALLAFLLRGDPRILHLCVLVKYWAKVQNLTGTGKLSNYSLIMLVIFYLQQQENPLLPSVQWLQRGQACFIDGWNTGFMDQFPLVPPAPNHSTLDQLLGGFFVFCANFNFAEMIACPYLGIAVPKKQFENTADVPNDFEIYKSLVGKNYAKPLRINSEMCIQDPFEQAHNIASSVMFRLFHEIIQTFKWAADLYQNDLKNNCTNFLKQILLEKPKINPVNVPNFKCKAFIQFSTVKHLPEAIWKEKVIEKFYTVFEDILKFEVTKQEDPPENKGVNIVHYREYYMLKSTRVLWRRKQMSKLYNALKMEFISRQKKITEDLIKVDKAKTHSPIIVDVEVMFVKCPRKVTITLKGSNETQEHFHEFGAFCASNLSFWFWELFKTDINGGISEQDKSLQNPSSGDRADTVDASTSKTDNVQNSTACGFDDVTDEKTSDSDNKSDNVESEQCCGATDAKNNSDTKPKPKLRDGNHSSLDNPPWKMLKKD